MSDPPRKGVLYHVDQWTALTSYPRIQSGAARQSAAMWARASIIAKRAEFWIGVIEAVWPAQGSTGIGGDTVTVIGAGSG